MASYIAPGLEQIQNWTGVNIGAVELGEGELAALLEELLQNTEAEVAQIVGESRFDSSALSPRQAVSLAEAVAYGVAARFLVHPQVCRATGTHRPLLVEDSAEIADVSEDLGRKSRNLARLVANGPAISNAQIRSSSLEAGYSRRNRQFRRTGDLA